MRINKKKNQHFFECHPLHSTAHSHREISRANAINIVADLGRSGGEFNTKLIYCISFFQPIKYFIFKKIYTMNKNSMISFTF